MHKLGGLAIIDQSASQCRYQDLYVLCQTFYASPVYQRSWDALTDEHKASIYCYIERTSGGFSTTTLMRM